MEIGRFHIQPFIQSFELLKTDGDESTEIHIQKLYSVFAMGIFVFKNNFKPLSKHKKCKKFVKSNDQRNIFSDTLWYHCYSELWETIEEKIEVLNNEMFSSVLGDLITFIKNSHNKSVDEIPTAALLTGINMPDHEAQFKALSKQIKQSVSPHVACLYSQDCQTLKYLMENMISQFINEDEIPSDEEMEVEDNVKHIKKNLLNLSVLQCWYEDLYKEDISSTPKKQKTKLKKKVLVVIIPDFESFTAQVLQKFILIVNWYIRTLPFVFVFGIAISINTLHITLPYQVSSKISVHVFNSQPSIDYLNTILEEVFFTIYCPFQLGGKVFNLFTDIFLFYDFSVSNFIHNIKYAMAEHFSYGATMALCSSHPKKIKQILDNFNHEDCENARRLLSFRKLVENESYKNRIKLLTDDEHFKSVLEQEVNALKRYVRRLHVFLKCLHTLVNDLPKFPLGKQLRELYSFAVTSNITRTPEYKECFQLLGFQSKDELSTKLSKVIDYVSSIVNDTNKPNRMKDFVNELNNYWTHMNNFDVNNSEEDIAQCKHEDNFITGQMDRKQLKEKLLEMSKQQNKPMNRYEELRKNVLQFLSERFEEYLVEPSSLYFHEIFFFNNISIHNYIVGAHRSAIHNALNDPHYYLQCNCCSIPNNSVIKPSMPDICITYKLHLECGKMINLYDWLQAFLSIVDPVNVNDDDGKRIVDPELQARFTQAVAELEFLGFIKSSKRKADHVTRLTWGG